MTYNVTFPHLGLEFNINPVAFHRELPCVLVWHHHCGRVLLA